MCMLCMLCMLCMCMCNAHAHAHEHAHEHAHMHVHVIRCMCMCMHMWNICNCIASHLFGSLQFCHLGGAPKVCNSPQEHVWGVPFLV